MDFSRLPSLAANIVLMPPTSLLLLMLAGYLLRRRWPRTGRSTIAAGALTLLVLSTGAGARLLARPLENMTTPLYDPRAAGAQAIVVLGAASVERAPEYDGADVPDPVALVRLQYGARLQHATGLPLLVSGGLQSSAPGAVPVGVTMARVLREDFRTPVTWIEGRSRDTAQNAAFSARMLKAAGVRRVLLVTHAMHMPRSRAAFAREGMEVVEAPTAFYSRGPFSPMMLVPSASALYRSFYATHEWVGLAWYRLRAA
ncbi:YdcF family protein [Massilia sp. PAMC28688]|nr:YdcF family protein [Massilia sp. PAMC28688]